MKKKLFVFLLAIMAVFALIGNNVKTNASSATSTTYTLDYKGNWVATQDAYLPKLTFTEFGLSSPSDMVINGNTLYLSDTGNKRILLIDTQTGKIKEEILSFTLNGEKLKFKNPMGLFINTNPDEVYCIKGELLYVCDSIAEKVYIFNNKLECVKEISKPTSILFSNREFNPQKIATDLGGNMFIIGEGINEGIMQLSIEGEFLGYFATNEVTTTFKEKLQDLLYTDEQKDQLPIKTPPVFSSVYADSKGTIYSTTTYTYDYPYIQKHNTAGQNQFTKYPLYAEQDMIDLCTDFEGMVYAVSKKGYIYVYTEQGEFIYTFGEGGSIHTPDINGWFSEVSAIAVDNNRSIWVLDREKETIQTFVTTDYSKLIYEAYSEYLKSNYKASIDKWNEVLKLNQMSNLAHNNIGLNYLYSQEYELAMHHLKISNNKTDYSKAYWEVRNLWLQDNLSTIVIIGLSLIAVYFALKFANSKKKFMEPVNIRLDKVKNIPYIREYTDMFRIARHPEDGFYDLKVKKKGSFRGAVTILFTLFAVFLIYLTCKGFIYQQVEAADLDIVSIIIGFFGLIFIFIICNYLVTSITDGNGSMKDIFVLFMYSLAPVIIGLISIVILSHFLTESESFFLDVIFVITLGWSVILIGMGMIEIQGYRFKELIISLLLTLMLMVIIVLVLLILFVLSQDLIDFFKLIVQEVIRIVKG